MPPPPRSRFQKKPTSGRAKACARALSFQVSPSPVADGVWVGCRELENFELFWPEDSRSSFGMGKYLDRTHIRGPDPAIPYLFTPQFRIPLNL